MAEETTAVAAPVAAAPDAGTTAAPATAAPATPAAPTAAPDAGTQAAAPVVVDPAAPAAPAEAAAVVPDKYEFVAPDNTVLDPAVSTEFASLAKDLKLSQADAQKVIDRMGPLLAKGEGARDATRIQAAVERAAATWSEQAKADKEIGGDNLDKNLALAKQTFATFGTPELEAVLKASGLDSHPELLRWAVRVGKQIAPDGKVVQGNFNQQPGGTFEERAANKLYK